MLRPRPHRNSTDCIPSQEMGYKETPDYTRTGSMFLAHVISEGIAEDDRTPDMRRCERIGWIRPMVDSCQTDRVRCWRNMRNGRERIVIALPDFSYVVVLQENREYVMLWTAYYIETEHRRAKLRREFDNWAKNASAAF